MSPLNDMAIPALNMANTITGRNIHLAIHNAIGSGSEANTKGIG